ncbi:MAG: type II toxin-antitoxin system RelE/ParE family toxin [Flavobacteriales bacterium]|nr:type II toxin-antitoxin system RelE/ParE family toxin [Flavobacteriales bacterium]
MVESVRWSPEAEARFRAVVSYLRTNWSVRDAHRFMQRTDQAVRMIMRFPGMSRKGRKGTREVLVTKHNIMTFRIKKKELQIVGFWDTRQHPSRRRISEL